MPQVEQVTPRTHYRRHGAFEPPRTGGCCSQGVTGTGKAGIQVDADHINLTNVDGFAATADFFTLDVADAVGEVNIYGDRSLHLS